MNDLTLEQMDFDREFNKAMLKHMKDQAEEEDDEDDT